MRGGVWMLVWGIPFGVLLLVRFLCMFLSWGRKYQGTDGAQDMEPREMKKRKRLDIGICQIMGDRELQADRAQAWSNNAGTMAAITDGIGRANTGAVCAQVAVDAILDQFEPYEELNNPSYFFRTAFSEAHRRIGKTVGGRRGGASAGAVFLDGAMLHYAVAGNVKIALLRGQELIPLSRGQTMAVLAADAYEEGRISRQDAVWSMEEKRIWNYLGKDGFHEIETCAQPIRLKRGDKVFMASKGIFDVLSWREMEDILMGGGPAQELAGRLAAEAERKGTCHKDKQQEGAEKKSPDQNGNCAVRDKDNGSVILIGYM